MRLLQWLLMLGGGALALTGLSQNHGWMAGAGGVLFLVGAVMWIANPRIAGYANSGKPADDHNAIPSDDAD